ncbi:9663_t:CDS:2 [Funneliformis geosporum]|nr:9663_t:CDS:2 [Funneliformis geosporum]
MSVSPIIDKIKKVGYENPYFLKLKQDHLLKIMLLGPAIVLTDFIDTLKDEHQALHQKRGYDESMFLDQTDKICNELVQPFKTIPKRAHELKSLIDQPLLRKLPAAAYEELKSFRLKELISTSDKTT